MPLDGRGLVAESIRQKGPLTVAQYMELALYAPEVGYYSRRVQASGREGDFYTSVDVGPLFGRLLAFQFAEMARALASDGDDAPLTIDLVEAAAGNGRLSRDILDAAEVHHRWFYDRVALHLVERSASARAAHADGLGPHAGKLRSSCDHLPARITGVVFANELLDALPAHQVEMTADGLREIYVDLDGDRLVDRAGPLSTPSLDRYLDQVGVRLDVGTRAEINLDAQNWVRDAAARLASGYLVIIDYGYPAAELYGPHRSRGTLSTFARHQLDGPGAPPGRAPAWLADPGSRDITAHVDFTGIQKAAEGAGLTLAGVTDQTHLLMNIAASSGLLDELNASERVKERLALKTLVVPGGLGSTHSVIVFASGGVGTKLTGLRKFRD